MIRIARTLPGELEGKVNPEDYGFEVIKEDPPNETESARRVAHFYAQIKERTGMIIPPIEKYLEDSGEAVGASRGTGPSQKGSRGSEP
jgi:hypothetical protein